MCDTVQYIQSRNIKKPHLLGQQLQTSETKMDKH